LLSAVAEGITKNQAGKIAAVIAVETLKHNFKKGYHRAFSIEDFFEESFAQMQKSFRDNINQNKFGARLAAVIIDGGILNYAVIGDCALYLYRNKKLVSLKLDYKTHIHSKHIGSIAIEPHDTVLIASGGINSLTEMEIIWYLDLDGHPQEKCQKLLKKAQEKQVRLGNMALIILEDIPPQTQTRRHKV
jgi:serine/threonine protein phosphatase PrpC